MPPDRDRDLDPADRLESLEPALGLSIPPRDRQRLLAYLGLIQRWTRVYNLTAVRDAEEMFTHHLLDCLAVVAPLRRELAGPSHAIVPDPATPSPAVVQRPAVQLLDVGSGAGLPGVVIAVLNPDWQVTCVDAVAKKVTFIRQVAAELGLPNLIGVHGRVEEAGNFGGQQYDLVTSRAFASLGDFVSLTRPRLKPNGRWVAMKANLTATEQAEIPGNVEVFHVEQLTVPMLDAARCLVWMRPANTDPANSAQP